MQTLSARVISSANENGYIRLTEMIRVSNKLQNTTKHNG